MPPGTDGDILIKPMRRAFILGHEATENAQATDAGP